MRRWEKILIVFMIVVVAGIIAFGVWQRENLRAGMMVLIKSTNQIAQEMDDNKKKLEEELKKRYQGIISDFTAEEEKKIIKGEISVEEAVDELNKKYEDTLIDVSQDSDSSASAGDTSNRNSQADRFISEKIVQLYSLKAYYLGQLGQLEATVKNEYLSLPKEKRNLVGKKSLVDKYMNVALGHMESCDKKVAELLKELENELVAIGADTSIIKTIKNAYEEEKTLKKAYYIKLLEE